MNEMQVFNHKLFGNIRIMEEDGKMLFCASDVASALQYAKPRNAVATHCKGALKRGVPTSGGVQGITFITEGDIYRLITHSKLPSAQKFESWIFDEVLPSIRKHGAYATPQTIDNIINNPDFGIRLLTELKAERRKSATLKAANDQLTAKIEADKPKVQFADSVTASKESITIGELAKILKQNGLDIGRNRLYARLRSERYLNSSYKNYNIPSQYAMNLGLFEIMKYPYTTLCGVRTVGTSIYVTPHGQQYFINKLLKATH